MMGGKRIFPCVLQSIFLSISHSYEIQGECWQQYSCGLCLVYSQDPFLKKMLPNHLFFILYWGGIIN